MYHRRHAPCQNGTRPCARAVLAAAPDDATTPRERATTRSRRTPLRALPFILCALGRRRRAPPRAEHRRSCAGYERVRTHAFRGVHVRSAALLRGGPSGRA